MLRRLKETARREKAHLDERRQEGHRAAAKVAEKLREVYGVKRAWLVGSMARDGSVVSEGSDLDVVVEGLPANAHVHGGVLADREAPAFTVDLIRLEELDSSIRELFLKEGIPI